MGTQIWNRVHNFGIYKKGGKRCILQLDFPGRVLLIIQKGHIKKSHNFDTLEHYDSEEGLHVALKFRECEFDFETDNSEEKYTICRLMGLVIQMGHGEDDDSMSSIDSGQGLSSLGDHHLEGADIIKDGLLEKKGNTAITLWNKRRIKLTPGEFTYYKPGEDLALNIVQLWPDHTALKKHGLNGFSVAVRDRVYNFRVLSDYKAINMTEIVRNEWFLAFERALNYVPPTAKLFEASGNNKDTESNSHNNTDDPEHIYDLTPDMAITAHVTVHLNYIDKALPSPPKTSHSLHHTLEHFLPFGHRDHKEHKASSSKLLNLSTQSSSGDDPLDGETPFTGSAAELRAKLAMQGGKSSALKAYRAHNDFKKRHGEDKTLSSTKLKAFHLKNLRTSDIQSNVENDPNEQIVANGGELMKIKERGSVKLLQIPNVKLKQVHWVKVNNNQISGSIWRDAHDMTEKLDLFELEEQFAIHEKKPALTFLLNRPEKKEERQMLVDAKRAQNLGILFCGLKLESLAKLNEALNSITELDTFPADKMTTLKRYQPNAEDKEMYKLYTDKRDTLHNADRFMLELCEIPQLSHRLDLVLTIWELPDQHTSLVEEVEDLLLACDEILSSSALPIVMEYLLAIGNYMNASWNSKQGALGFQLSSIEKILSVKGHDNKTTLCTYLVKQLKQNDPHLLGWPKCMGHVTKCAGYSIKAVGAEIDGN
ncbi:unnamed protein product [Lymnaea stagnalis]|uniref:FH2 domain-containing protein n=1 Tax=Lymnaea stagnalis TaxID=6523 RepID=A0AAV2HH91_LYMST